MGEKEKEWRREWGGERKEGMGEKEKEWGREWGGEKRKRASWRSFFRFLMSSCAQLSCVVSGRIRSDWVDSLRGKLCSSLLGSALRESST